MSMRLIVFFVASLLAGTVARVVQPNGSLFAGHYKEGERVRYLMKGKNGNWRYQIRAAGIVKRDSKERWVEEFTWSHLVSNGASVALPPSVARFRQVVSLDPAKPPSLPNLSAVPPALIGPITDLATFYVDLWLARRLGSKLERAGDNIDLKLGIPASWADGKHVVVGQSAVDFDISLVKVDRSAGVVALLVQHVPPAQAKVHLPATWMDKPVSGTPNNWVQVTKRGDKFVAAVGKETFDVRMKVSLANGEILSATLGNLVEAQERDCRNAALTKCGPPHPLQIRRHIEISSMN